MESNMSSYLVLEAFFLGVISACSLPLGSLTSVVWQPKNWTLAFLIAFGAGAFLAALTFELVVPALEEEYFSSLAAGSIVGSLLFLGLNQLVNNHGGFLRKDTTTAQ